MNKETEYTKSYLERLTIFALMWRLELYFKRSRNEVYGIFFSMGALLELNDRAKLEQYFVDCHDADIPKNIAQGGSMFDYFVNDQGQWGK